MDTVDLIDNPAVAAWRKEEAERYTEQLAWDVSALMVSESGRRLAWWVLSTAGIYHTSYRQNALEMAFVEGKRDLGLRFLDLIQKHASNEFLLMQQEQSNERRERDARKQHAISGS